MRDIKANRKLVDLKNKSVTCKMEIKIEDFKLSTELLGHSLDVRAVATVSNCIISGSRDKTAKIWEITDDG